MAKKEVSNAHPEQHEITLVLSNKEKIQIKTTWGKPGEVLTADLDPFNHPAWLKDGDSKALNAGSKRIDDFNKKFGGFAAFDTADAA